MKNLKLSFVALATLVLGTFVFIACSESSESESKNQPFGNKKVVDLESLYLGMIQSQSYIYAEEKLQSFVTKMNFNGNVSDIDTDAKMFSWISANLSSTDFVNLAEAEAHWRDALDLGRISFQENIEIYAVIGGREKELKDLILINDPVVPQPVANSTCDENLLFCTSNATISFMTSVNEAYDLYQNGSITSDEASDRIQTARRSFTISAALCGEEFANCVFNG